MLPHLSHRSNTLYEIHIIDIIYRATGLYCHTSLGTLVTSTPVHLYFIEDPFLNTSFDYFYISIIQFAYFHFLLEPLIC